MRLEHVIRRAIENDDKVYAMRAHGFEYRVYLHEIYKELAYAPWIEFRRGSDVVVLRYTPQFGGAIRTIEFWGDKGMADAEWLAAAVETKLPVIIDNRYLVD